MASSASGDRGPVAPLPTEKDFEATTPNTIRHSSDVQDHRFSNKRFSQLSRFSQLTTPWDSPRQTQDFSETQNRDDLLANQNRQSTGSDVPSDAPTETEHKGRLEPTSKWSPHQLFYVFGLDGIGSLIISGGINFAIAYGMYASQDLKTKPIRLWQLPNTFAGDAAVTIIIQCIMTWFIEWGLVSLDLSNKGVAPIGFIKEPTHFIPRWFFFLTATDSLLPISRPKNDEEPQVEKQKNWKSILLLMLQNALRGFCFAVVGFLILWPIFVGALTAFGTKKGGDYYYGNKWTPQVFKLLLGGVLGLLTTPLMAMFWLVKAGWDAK